MSDTNEDPIIDYLKNHRWSLFFRAWFKGADIEPRNFEGNPEFSATAQSISDWTASDFRKGPYADDEVIDADELDPILTIEYTDHFKGVRGHEPFVVISGKTEFIIITPVRYWSYLDQNYSTGKTTELEVEAITYETRVTTKHSEDKIVGETWEHTTKRGDRDLRYRKDNNRRIYLVLRHCVQLRLHNGLQWQFGYLVYDDPNAFFIALLKLVGADYEPNKNEDNDEKSEEYVGELDAEDDAEEAWNAVLGVSPTASDEEIKVAYRDKIKQYHPDGVFGRGDKLKALALQETKKINAAKDQGLALWNSRRIAEDKSLRK